MSGDYSGNCKNKRFDLNLHIQWVVNYEAVVRQTCSFRCCGVADTTAAVAASLTLTCSYRDTAFIQYLTYAEHAIYFDTASIPYLTLFYSPFVWHNMTQIPPGKNKRNLTVHNHHNNQVCPRHELTTCIHSFILWMYSALKESVIILLIFITLYS